MSTLTLELRMAKHDSLQQSGRGMKVVGVLLNREILIAIL